MAKDKIEWVSTLTPLAREVWISANHYDPQAIVTAVDKVMELEKKADGKEGKGRIFLFLIGLFPFMGMFDASISEMYSDALEDCLGTDEEIQLGEVWGEAASAYQAALGAMTKGHKVLKDTIKLNTNDTAVKEPQPGSGSPSNGTWCEWDQLDYEALTQEREPVKWKVLNDDRHDPHGNSK